MDINKGMIGRPTSTERVRRFRERERARKLGLLKIPSTANFQRVHNSKSSQKALKYGYLLGQNSSNLDSSAIGYDGCQFKNGIKSSPKHNRDDSDNNLKMDSENAKPNPKYILCNTETIYLKEEVWSNDESSSDSVEESLDPLNLDIVPLRRRQTNSSETNQCCDHCNLSNYNYMNDSHNYIDNDKRDPDMAFMYSILPDVALMSIEQKRRFKIGVLKLASEILQENTSTRPVHVNSLSLNFSVIEQT